MLRKYSLRFCLVFLTLIVCLLGFIGKLAWMQIFRNEHLAELGRQQHQHIIDIEPRRGTIYDRHGNPLALNVTVYSLFANPRKMNKEDKNTALKALSSIISLEPRVLRKRLNKNKYFVWIKRKLNNEQYEKIKALNLRGLGFRKESKRLYPNSFLASHVLGFTSIDHRGLEGLEMMFQHYLKGREGKSQIIRDAKQRELMIEDVIQPVQHGFDLYLTLDETIQFIAENALDTAYKKYKAKSASIIVMDPRTGEILALANRPTYNLNEANLAHPSQRTNRAVAHVYEPGSVFKIVTASAALEEEISQEEDVYFCENGKYKIGNHYLKDHKPHGDLTFREVFEKSSNICTAKVAQQMGADMVYEYGKRFRFGMMTKIEMPGEVRGWLKHPKSWSKTSIGAIPMGQEVTVTPLQLAAAIGTIANGGIYMKPHVVKAVKNQNGEMIKSFPPQPIDRVMSEQTSLRMRSLLGGVVENGTGTAAKIQGMAVGGKTGTAQKVVDGRYSHSKYYASFIGVAPVSNPQLAVVVVVNEPRPVYYGGLVAGPVFKDVVEKSLKYLEGQKGFIR